MKLTRKHAQARPATPPRNRAYEQVLIRQGVGPQIARQKAERAAKRNGS